jgi:Microsomal signal peptidase 25 kDa subunit (SPC25)
VKKHAPIYRLKVRYEAPSGKTWEDKEVEGRFIEWFNEDGYLQQAELKTWLARNIEVVGKADPQSKEAIEDQALGKAIELPNEPARSSGLEAPSGAKAAKKSKRKA